MDTPPAQRVISDRTPWALRPTSIVGMCLGAFAVGGWAMNVTMTQTTIIKWSEKADRRFDRIEAALGIHAPTADRPSDRDPNP